MLWRCWLGGRKGIRPVKTEWWGAGVVICLEQGADLHTAQLMPLPLTVSCFSKIQIGFTFLVLAHLGSPGQRAVKRVCVCVHTCCCVKCCVKQSCLCWMSVFRSACVIGRTHRSSGRNVAIMHQPCGYLVSRLHWQDSATNYSIRDDSCCNSASGGWQRACSLLIIRLWLINCDNATNQMMKNDQPTYTHTHTTV